MANISSITSLAGVAGVLTFSRADIAASAKH